MLDIFKLTKKYQQYRKVIERSGLFDSNYYLKKNRVKIIDITPIDHFCKYGLEEDLKPNSEFDPVWYREYYKDVKDDGAFPFIHYIIYGSKEGRFQNEEQLKNNLLISNYYQHLNSINEVEKDVEIRKSIYDIVNKPLINIIISFKDESDLVDRCISTILKLSTYKNYKIIGISNNSKETETFSMMKRLNEKDVRISFYEHNIPCNNYKINNYAVKNYAKGEHIILLDGNIEIITPDWMEYMLEYSQKEDVGAIGTLLHSTDGMGNHFNASIGVEFFLKDSKKDLSLVSIENISAVSAKCLMVKKSIFDEVDGLNEKNLIFDFNDIDFCLRIFGKGYKNILIPCVEVFYHKPILKGFDNNLEEVKKFSLEMIYMKKRHKNILMKNINLR